MTHDQMIAVIQAYKEGKTIEACVRHDVKARWFVPDGSPQFNFAVYDYRVKKEPRTRILMDIFNKPSGSFSHSTVFNTMAEWEHWKKTMTNISTYYTYSEPYEVVERI